MSSMMVGLIFIHLVQTGVFIMNRIKSLAYHTIPCWYELSWDSSACAIIFKLHKRAIVNNDMGFDSDFPKDSPIIGFLKENLSLGQFHYSLDSDFGFDGALHRIGEDTEFIIFSGALPNARKNIDGKCLSCGGTGNSSICDDEKCMICGGDGKNWEFDHNSLFTVSSSFIILFTAFAGYCDYNTECEYPQLMTVDMTAEKRSVYGACIGGKFGIDLVKWMSTFNPNTKITEMIEAIKCAYGQMSGIVPDKYERFLASIDYENGWLNVSCPGNACGLNPSNGNVCAGEGYGFSPHNTDTPLQQLTLLAGLAALHDKARKEMP
ncbi:hypothetical protein ACFLY0_01930 [Patescibacteria group bacterium]